MTGVPGRDLQSPALERATQRTDLRWSDLVREIGGQLIEPGDLKFLVLVAVELSNGFLRVPGGGHIALRVTGLEQVQQLASAVFTQALLGLGEEASASIEGVVFVAAVSERLVLDPAPRLVELGRRQLDHVEGIGNEGGIGELGGEDRLVGGGQVEGAVGDGGLPGRVAVLEPLLRALTASSLDDVQELSLADVDDGGDEARAVVGGETDEAVLVEAQRGDGAEALRVLDEGCAIGQNRVVDGVPVAAQGAGHIVHAAAGFADRPGGPAPGPIGDGHARSSDPAILFGPGLLRTVAVAAAPPALVPEQCGGDTVDRQVAVLDDDALLHLGNHPAVRTPRRGGPRLDVDLKHRAVTIGAQHHDVGQVDEDRAGARRVLVHGGSPGSCGVRSLDSGSPRSNSGGPQTLLNSEVPLFLGSLTSQAYRRRVTMDGPPTLAYDTDHGQRSDSTNSPIRSQNGLRYRRERDVRLTIVQIRSHSRSRRVSILA